MKCVERLKSARLIFAAKCAKPAVREPKPRGTALSFPQLRHATPKTSYHAQRRRPPLDWAVKRGHQTGFAAAGPLRRTRGVLVERGPHRPDASRGHGGKSFRHENGFVEAVQACTAGSPCGGRSDRTPLASGNHGAAIVPDRGGAATRGCGTVALPGRSQLDCQDIRPPRIGGSRPKRTESAGPRNASPGTKFAVGDGSHEGAGP